eukprot:scaffold57827_cov51-Phaeocystis_antarctica.AAC.2
MQTKTPMPMQQSTSKPPTVSEARDARYKLSRVARQWRCVRAGGPALVTHATDDGPNRARIGVVRRGAARLRGIGRAASTGHDLQGRVHQCGKLTLRQCGRVSLSRS